jgi:hypothetical protein
LKNYSNSESDCTVAYYYFDFNDAHKQDVTALLSSIIGQLSNKLVDLPEQLKELHGRYLGQQRATLRELKPVLFETMRSLNDVFIILDALDECSAQGNKREQLLEILKEIKVSTNLHLLVTSRPEPDIKESLEPLLTIPSVSLGGSPVEADIKIHVRHELESDPNLKKWPPRLQIKIESTLVEKSNGM